MNVTLNDGLAEMGETINEMCESLREIAITPGIKVIKDGAFSDFTRTTAENLNDGLEEMGNEAFFFSILLGAEIVIPPTVKAMRCEAFKVCSGLMTVTLGNSLPHSRTAQL